jgi:hypothetical protein
MHDPIDPQRANGASAGERSQFSREEAARAETAELQRLMASRAERGLADFRDPFAQEGASAYETALRTERGRRGLPPGEPRHYPNRTVKS